MKLKLGLEEETNIILKTLVTLQYPNNQSCTSVLSTRHFHKSIQFALNIIDHLTLTI